MPKKTPTKRSPQEQAAIDKRMAAMRASRAKKKSSEQGELLPTGGAEKKSGVSTPAAASSAPAPQSVDNTIREWEFTSLADLASLPRHHIPLFTKLLTQQLHRLEGNQAITKIRFNEHGRFFCETEPVDPLS